MLNAIIDSGWKQKALSTIANDLLQNVSVILLNNGQVVGVAKIDEHGITNEGYQIKATYINDTSNEIVYDTIVVKDRDGQPIATVSPNITSIPPYKRVSITVLLELL